MYIYSDYAKEFICEFRIILPWSWTSVRNTKYLMILAVQYFFEGDESFYSTFLPVFPWCKLKRFRIMIIHLKRTSRFLPVFTSFRPGSNETKLDSSVGFPHPLNPALPMPGSTAWVICSWKSYVCLYPRKVSFTFLAKILSQLPTERWCFADLSSHHAPSSSASSRETWGKEHTQTHTDYPVSTSYCSI